MVGLMTKVRQRRRGQRGFTLVELLIVVTILGILAGIVSVSLIGLTGSAAKNACNTEVKGLQSAVDSYMAANQLDLGGLAAGGSAGPPVAAINNMTAPVPLFPRYMRSQSTKYFYTWDSNGQLTGVYSDAGGTAAPTGCTTPS